jgi:outer membrane protein
MRCSYYNGILGGLALLLCWNTNAAAQQKFGYINSDKILKKMPEYTGIQQKLNTLSSQWKEKLNRMKQHIDSLKKQFEAKKLLFSHQRKAREKEKIQQLTEARKRYLKQKFGPGGAYFQKQKALLLPIQRKLYRAVSTVADQKGIDFVFDRAKNTSLFYARKQWNLNKEVLQALHVTLPLQK